MLERDNAVPLMGRRRLPMAPHPMNPPEPARQENSENDPSGRKGAK